MLPSAGSASARCTSSIASKPSAADRNTAITASPIVFTIAPSCSAIDFLDDVEMAHHAAERSRVANLSIELG